MYTIIRSISLLNSWCIIDPCEKHLSYRLSDCIESKVHVISIKSEKKFEYGKIKLNVIIPLLSFFKLLLDKLRAATR